MIGRPDLYLIEAAPDFFDMEDVMQDKRPAAGFVGIESLSTATEGMSGADIKSILQNARRRRFTESLRSGNDPMPLSQHDLLQAIHRHRTSRLNAAD